MISNNGLDDGDTIGGGIIIKEQRNGKFVVSRVAVSDGGEWR